jgi:hypothetical protein
MKFSSVFPNKGQEFKVTATSKSVVPFRVPAETITSLILATGQTCHGMEKILRIWGSEHFGKAKKSMGQNDFPPKMDQHGLLKTQTLAHTDLDQF